MTFTEQLSKDKVLKFIQDFKSKYMVEPTIGFMAGYFKMTTNTIRVKLEILEKEEKIKFIKKNTNKTKYILL